VSVVSKSLRHVLTATTPFSGADQRYQTDARAGANGRPGSFGSAVAQRLLPDAAALRPPPRSAAFAKSSFGGKEATAEAGDAATPTPTPTKGANRNTNVRETKTVKGQKEVVIDIAALRGKGYPAPVNLDTGGAPQQQPKAQGKKKA
jgi:hypothetical protein